MALMTRILRSGLKMVLQTEKRGLTMLGTQGGEKSVACLFTPEGNLFLKKIKRTIPANWAETPFGKIGNRATKDVEYVYPLNQRAANEVLKYNGHGTGFKPVESVSLVKITERTPQQQTIQQFNIKAGRYVTSDFVHYGKRLDPKTGYWKDELYAMGK